MAGTGFNETRAELFEALGHPMRIKILEALESKPMGFADLKKQMGIESSGHLQFHLRKLGSLVQGEDSGEYSLSDEGREALRVFRTTAHSSSRSNGGGARFPRLGKKAVAVAAAAILLLVLVASAISGLTLYSPQSYLAPSYAKWYPGLLWHGAEFNDSQGKALVSFFFTLRDSNQSQSPIGVTLSFGPSFDQGSAPAYLDSAQLTFSTGGSGNWPDVGVRASFTSGGLEPTQVTRLGEGDAILSFQSLGFYGTGLETVDLWFRLLGVDASAGSNHTVTMKFDFVAHTPHPFLVGQSFTGEAVFHLIVEPSGAVLISEN